MLDGARAGEDIWDAPDNLAPEDYEEFEESVVDQATAARTIGERYQKEVG